MTVTARRHWDLLLLAGGALLGAAAVVLIPIEAVKVLLAVPLCLLLPGYAIALALFGKAPLELSARLLLASSLSVMSLVLGGIALNELPGGLNEGNWVALVTVLTEGGALTAWYRRGGHAADPSRFPPVRIPRFRPASVVVVVLAVVIGTGALVASRAPLPAKLANGYESVSLAPADGNEAVNVVLSSMRQHPASYHLEVSIAGRVVTARSVTLEPGASLRTTVKVGRSPTTRQVSATAVMTGRGGHWTPRQVQVQLPATS